MDTLRLLYETDRSLREGIIEPVDGWRAASIPALGLTWVEGHPTAGALATPREVEEAGEQLREWVDIHLGLRADRGVARVDLTTTRPFDRQPEARAFLAGMAATELPRCETTWRGSPAHSISWTHAAGRRKLARCYDKGLERGGEPFRSVRLEDQRRFRSGARPPLDEVADGGYQREKFVQRFEPMRKAVDGVKAASFPVIAEALADEVTYGYRSFVEAEKLAGSLVLFAAGVKPSRGQSTLYRRRAALKEAGYVIADGLLEPVEVNLGDELERALEEFGS